MVPRTRLPRGIPDEAGVNDEASKKVPSWRRICKALLRNDYWCKGLSFTQTKSEAYEKYSKIMKRRRQQWGLTKFFLEIDKLPLDEKIKAINEIKIKLHEISPFKN